MNLNEGTRRAIGAVGLFVVTILLVLAALGKGGLVGGKVYSFLENLLGVGYYFLPVVLFTLAVVFALPKDEEQNVATAQIISAGVLFLSGLGLVGIFSNGKGGLLGNVISQPLLSLFDTVAATVLLIGITIVAILAMFNSALHLHLLAMPFAKLFKKDGEGDKGADKPEKPMKIVGDVDGDDAPMVKIPADIRKGMGDGRKAGDEAGAFGSGSKKSNVPAGPVFRLASMKPYNPPPIDLLEGDKGKPGVGDIKANANIIKRTLQNFGIDVEMDEISIGPSVTRYALKPAEGVKLARIVALQNDLALALAAHPLRIEAPIPGKSLVGIEIPNSVKTTVGLASLMGASEFTESGKPLLVGLGKGVSGHLHFANFAKMPHLLVAGATGSGKSVTIHTIITSLLYRNSPEHMKFIMIDPKRVELTLYNKIPHLLTPVITEPKKAILALKWAAKEMDRRYDLLQNEHVRDIDSYHKNVLQPKLEEMQKNGGKFVGKDGEENAQGPETMPYIIIVLDELADIMQTFPRELESAIVRLAQMSRAVGIHLLLSTQRPSVNVITGLIKANIPTRIALQVTSQIDSRTIIDGAGAEKLLGAGDMLFQSSEMPHPQRIQSAFISEREVKSVVDYLKKEYLDELMTTIDITGQNANHSADSSAAFDSFSDDESADDDELYEEAKEIVMSAGKASTSFLQRKLRIGYARAARLIDILEERGVVSSGSGAKPRDVLMRDSGMPGLPASSGGTTSDSDNDEPGDSGSSSSGNGGDSDFGQSTEK